MAQLHIPFDTFTRESSVNDDQISFNELIPPIEYDEAGNELPFQPDHIVADSAVIYRLLQPYLSMRFWTQFSAVVPLAAYLLLFQIFILRQSVSEAWTISAGLLGVIFGLMLFMEGLKVGLMPFGELLGISLPAKATLGTVITIVFLLGIGVTFAEPAIGALQAAGSLVDVAKAPYLYTLLTDWSGTLVLAVGVGVGLAAAVGTIRFIFGWSLKPLIYLTLTPVLLGSAYMTLDT